jgi:hypothetical protein
MPQQWPLQRLGPVQRRAQPHVSFFIGDQDHGAVAKKP